MMNSSEDNANTPSNNDIASSKTMSVMSNWPVMYKFSDVLFKYVSWALLIIITRIAYKSSKDTALEVLLAIEISIYTLTIMSLIFFMINEAEKRSPKTGYIAVVIQGAVILTASCIMVYLMIPPFPLDRILNELEFSKCR